MRWQYGFMGPSFDDLTEGVTLEGREGYGRRTDDDSIQGVRQWERRILIGLATSFIAVFAVWAGVVWDGTKAIANEVAAVRHEMSLDRIEQQQYRTLLERRITIVEQQQEYLRRLVERIERSRDLEDHLP